jgi:hypothetical protein
MYFAPETVKAQGGKGNGESTRYDMDGGTPSLRVTLRVLCSGDKGADTRLDLAMLAQVLLGRYQQEDAGSRCGGRTSYTREYPTSRMTG